MFTCGTVPRASSREKSRRGSGSSRPALRSGWAKTPEAALPELAGGQAHFLVEALERGLEEQPPGAGRPEGDGIELMLVERAHHLVTQLRAAANGQLHPFLPQTLAHRLDPIGKVRDVYHEVAADVGRGHDLARSVGHRRARHGHPLVLSPRSVVEFRQQVEVDVGARGQGSPLSDGAKIPGLCREFCEASVIAV